MATWMNSSQNHFVIQRWMRRMRIRWHVLRAFVTDRGIEDDIIIFPSRNGLQWWWSNSTLKLQEFLLSLLRFISPFFWLSVSCSCLWVCEMGCCCCLWSHVHFVFNFVAARCVHCVQRSLVSRFALFTLDNHNNNKLCSKLNCRLARANLPGCQPFIKPSNYIFGRVYQQHSKHSTAKVCTFFSPYFGRIFFSFGVADDELVDDVHAPECRYVCFRSTSFSFLSNSFDLNKFPNAK